MERFQTTTAIPTPEHERQPERNPFNIDTMTNDEVIETGRLLAAAADKLDDEPEAAQLDELWEKLQQAVGQLPALDMDRAHRLLSGQIASGNTHDLEAIAVWVEGFLEYDYELVRDTLIRIFADESLRGRGLAFDLAVQRLNGLKERFTPEQQVDFEAKLAAYQEG